MKRKDRKRHLESQYFFNCVCKACENDWACYDFLPNVGDYEVEDEIMRKLSSGDVEVARDVVEGLCEKLGELQEFQPCKSFCQVQEIVKQCFALMGNKRILF